MKTHNVLRIVTLLAVCVTGIEGIKLYTDLKTNKDGERENASTGRGDTGDRLTTGPKLRIEGGSTQHLGTLLKNETRPHQFKFKNISDRTISIVSVKPSCGCLGSAVPSKNVLPPGEKATYAVELIGSKRKSRTDNQNYVTFKFRDDTSQVLQFEYYVVEDVSFNPETVDVKAVYVGEKLAGSVLLTPLDWGPLTIKDVRAESDLIKSTRIKKIGAGFRIYTEIKSKEVAGEYSDNLLIKTNAKIDSKISIPFKWSVRPKIDVVPATIFLGNIDAKGPPVERYFQLKHIDSEPFEVTGIDYDDKKIDVRLMSIEQAVTGSYKYSVKIRQGWVGEDEILRETIQIKTDRGAVMLSLFGINANG